MIRGFPVLFVLLLVSTGIPLEQRTEITDGTVGTEIFTETATIATFSTEETKEEVKEEAREEVKEDSKEEKKDKKLDDEIYKIGQVIPEGAVAEENDELRINDAIHLNKKQDNLTMTMFRTSTTEVSKIMTTESVIESVGGLEQDDDGEQLRQPSEKELAELSEKLKEKEDSRKTDMETEKPMEEKEEEAVNVKSEVDELVTKEPKKMEEEMVKEEERKETMVDEKKEATISDVIEEHEFMETEQKEEEPKMEVIDDNEDDKISWDLVQFMLMLMPSEKEVSWWTIIVESVKCSLRNCPNSKSYWLRRPVYLPRITRHRRQDSEFDPQEVQTTSQPCMCQNLEAYFEKMYETIGKTKKEMNETRS